MVRRAASISLYAMAMRLTRDPHTAEDLVQDTLLRAYRALDRFDGRHPRAWLLTILRNTNINRGRKRTPALLIDPDRTFGQVPGPGADARDGAAEPALDRIADPALVRAPVLVPEDAPEKGTCFDHALHAFILAVTIVVVTGRGRVRRDFKS